MKYKFDVLVILNVDSQQVALPVINEQLANAEHIGKIFIGNTSLATLQVITTAMEQQTPVPVKYTKSKSASGRRVTHSVQTAEKPIILGLRDAEFNVLKDSPNPVVVIGTPAELNDAKTRELITSIQRPDKPVIEFLYGEYSAPMDPSMKVKYINLLLAIRYLAMLQAVKDTKLKTLLTMYKYRFDLDAHEFAAAERLDTNIVKTRSYRPINRALEAIELGIKSNPKKRKTITPVIKEYNASAVFVNKTGDHIANIVIVPENVLPSLETGKWHDLAKPSMFLIVITPENARVVTDLMVDSARIPTKTVGGRISQFFKGATDAVFGSESSRRRRRTQKQIQSKLRRTLKDTARNDFMVDDIKYKIANNLKVAQAANKVTKQKYFAAIEARGVRQARSNASNNVLKTISTAVKAETVLSPAELRKLEIARTLVQNVDKYIKEAHADYADTLKEFNTGVEQALAELDSKLSTAQKATNTATHALQAHQNAHGTNNNLTKKDVQIRLEVIATESDDAIDSMIKGLVNDTNDSINGLLRKFDVQSIRNVAMDNKKTFEKEVYALVLEATRKVNSILNDKYNAVHVQKAVHEFHNTMDKFKQDQALTMQRIPEYQAEIAARREILNQEIPMVKSGLFGKKPDPVVVEDRKRLKDENVALASKLAFEEYKVKMYTHITQAFVTLANVIIEIQAKLADRLAGIPDRQSKLEELNNALSELLKIQVSRKTLTNTRNTAVKTETSLQRRKADIAAGKFTNAPSLARRKQEVNNAKVAIPELTPVDKQDIMLHSMQNLAKHISNAENKLGSLSRKRRGAKWYQFGEKRTLKQQQAAKRAELSSLKRKQASIRRRQKEQVLG